MPDPTGHLARLRAPAVRRWLTLAVLTFGMAFLLVDYVRLPAEDWTIGEVADRDIRATVGFAYLDGERTAEVREEAETRVLPVFDWDPRLGERILAHISEAFEVARARNNETLLKARAQGRESLNAEEKSAISLEFVRLVGFSLDPEDLSLLEDLGWSREVEDASRELLSAAMRTYIIPDRSILPTSARSISVLVLGEGRNEIVLEDFGQIRTPSEARRQVSLSAFEEVQAEPEHLKAAVALARAAVSPNFSYNQAITEDRRKAAMEAAPEQRIRVARGTAIARAGDVLTRSQIEQINALKDSRGGAGPAAAALAVAGLAALSFLVVYQFAAVSLGRFTSRVRELEAGALLLMVITGISRLVLEISAPLSDGLGGSVSSPTFWFLVPFAGCAMLVRILVGAEASLVWTILGSALLGVQMDQQLLMTVYFALSGLVAARAVGSIRERVGVMRAGALTGLTNAGVAVLISLVQIYSGSAHTPTDGVVQPLWSALFAAIGGLLSGFLVLGLVPVFELFGFVTDFRLLELANLNHPLLKQLMLRAPGTYHHSVTVAQLSEAAAEAIGANALQTRVACYFHDIGKAVNPRYFVENQRGGPNPHDRLPPKTSARLIINHVVDGEGIARQYKLPQPIIDGITMHHGTGLIQYFYARALEQAGPNGTVDESDYRYPGQLPDSRESGIIMLADKVEAATRTLRDKSPESIRGLIQKLVNSTLMDGQLEKCPLTIKELYTIVDAFTESLLGIYHHRIEYPGIPHRGAEVGERPTGPVITLEINNPLRAEPTQPGLRGVGDNIGTDPGFGSDSPRSPTPSPDEDYESAEHLPTPHRPWSEGDGSA